MTQEKKKYILQNVRCCQNQSNSTQEKCFKVGDSIYGRESWPRGRGRPQRRIGGGGGGGDSGGKPKHAKIKKE